MSEYTKGPWVAAEHLGCKWITDGYGSRIADTVGLIGDKGEVIDLANARLIAAAPQLLEALKLLTADNANRGSAGAEVNWAAIHLAQAAIAKAEAQ